MKTSWNNSKIIENYLKGRLSQEEKLLFEALLLTDPILHLQVAWQEKTYALIQLFARCELKFSLEKTHQKLFQNPDKKDFQESVLQLFIKH